MDLYKIFNCFLAEREIDECRTKKIPGYYWYYLQAIKTGKGINGIKEIIRNRINLFLFNNDNEIRLLVNSVVRIIREFVFEHDNGQGLNIKELEKEFNEKISEAYGRIIGKKSEDKNSQKIKKGDKRKKTAERKKILKVISKTQGEELRPTLVYAGPAASDKDCLYYPECRKICLERRARLDCGSCPHQTIK